MGKETERERDSRRCGETTNERHRSEKEASWWKEDKSNYKRQRDLPGNVETERRLGEKVRKREK